MLTSRFLEHIAQSAARQVCKTVARPSVSRLLATTCTFRNEESDAPVRTSVAKYVLQGKQQFIGEVIVETVGAPEATEDSENDTINEDQLEESVEIETVEQIDISHVEESEIDEVIELSVEETLEIDEDVELSAEETLEIEEAEQLDCLDNDIPLEDDGIDIDEMLLNSAVAEDDDIEYIEDEEEFEDQGDDEIRTQVLSIALDHVPSCGWTMESIDKAVQLLDLSPAAAEMFKRGPLDLVFYFVEEANSTLTDHLAEQAKQTNLTTEKESADFIEQAIKTRLQMLIPYIDTWPQALKLMASPAACQDVIENGSSMMDEILYHAGDRSVDMSWYTRRAGLAGIYCTTEVFMMNDKSTDFRDTWAYLHRRMNDARALNRAKDSIDHAAADGLALLNAGISTGITTIQNMVGAGRRDR